MLSNCKKICNSKPRREYPAYPGQEGSNIGKNQQDEEDNQVFPDGQVLSDDPDCNALAPDDSTEDMEGTCFTGTRFTACIPG